MALRRALVESQSQNGTTGHRHEKTWDGHGSYQWTYLSHGQKDRIKFFLATRLQGKNLDLGGGWHLLYPSSTVVDLSSVCLQHNPAADKLHFDLDSVGRGARLPYPDHAFYSATMVSVWQYLTEHAAIVEEIQRVLVPGGKLYVINSQGAGLDGCITASTTSDGVIKFFEKYRSLDIVVENIPASRHDEPFHMIGELRSVSITMPGGRLPFDIDTVVRRIAIDPDDFSEEFANHEMATRRALLAELERYPITANYIDLRKNANLMAEEFYEKTGTRLLIFARSLPQEISVLNDASYGITVALESTVHRNGRDREALQRQLSEKYNVHGATYTGYLPSENITRFLQNLEKVKPVRRDRFGQADPVERAWDLRFIDAGASFVTDVPLTDFTESLQGKVSAILRSREVNFDSFVLHSQASKIRLLVMEFKGERRITGVIDAKKKIEAESAGIVGYAEYDFKPFLPLLRVDEE